MEVVEVLLLMVKLVVMVDKVVEEMLVVDRPLLTHLVDTLLELPALEEEVVLDIRLLLLLLMLKAVLVLL